MSNDVSGPSTSVDAPQNMSPQRDSSVPVEQAETQSSPPARVPVVVHGADDAHSLDPAEEVAMLLGEVETTGPKKDSGVDHESSVDVLTVSADEADSIQSTESDSELAGRLAAEEAEFDRAPGDQDHVSEIVPDGNEFEEMGLSLDVMDAITTAGYESPSPIQTETIPYILEGRDVMGQAETGSGKTAAFAWPLLSKIDVRLAKPQVLVLAPTRELAIQVTAAFEKYARDVDGFRAVTIYGGQSYETQLRALSRGVHVVVGTPGRVMDHLRRGTLDLQYLKTLVLDEADEMLRMGFIDDVEWILEQIPEQRQILSFSATLPAPIQRIAKKYLNNPANVAIESDTATADSIEQSCLFLHAREKMERLVRILETEETDGVIVFVKTRNATIMVAENLIQRGIIASALNGDIPQSQRERTVNQLKSGRINVVVATDVAARGLDVQRVSHVINYDFPHDTEAYVHRIGRTGRAGRTGNAILFVEPKEKGKLSRLQRATNQRIEAFKQRSLGEINQQRVSKFKQRVLDATADNQAKFFTKLISELQSESELPMHELAGALAVLAQGESPLLLKELKSPKSNWKKERGNSGSRDRGPMTTYRVEVGRRHNVGPGNIVGAVTNEANLSNADIGRINIFDNFSTIDLPADIPQDLIDHLRSVHVGGQRLAISKSERTYAKSGGRKSGPAQKGGSRYESGKKFGSKKFGDKKFGDKKFGDKKFGAKRIGDKKFGSKTPGDRPGSDPKFVAARAERKFEKSRDAGRSERPKVTGENFETKTSSDRPKTERKFVDRKPGKRKSNASGARTEMGEKRDRIAREGSYADKSRSAARSTSKYGKSKPNASASRSSAPRSSAPRSSAPKTKAAQRTKAKRKPGAKPSSPMKKYVKIRSAN